VKKRGEQQIPGQLKMFMTPSEIHEGWQALDADRYGRETQQSWQGSQSYEPPSAVRGVAGAMVQTIGDQGDYAWRSQGGTKYGERPETDEELYERKRSEAYGEADDDFGYQYEGMHMVGSSSRWSGGSMHEHKMTGTEDLSSSQIEARRYQRGAARGNAQYRRGALKESGVRTETHPTYWTEGSERYHEGSKTTLGESIEAEGVKSPIRLGGEVGSQGKPQIVGGHHRLAVASALHSEQLLPVLHYAGGIHEARADTAYPYT